MLQNLLMAYNIYVVLYTNYVITKVAASAVNDDM